MNLPDYWLPRPTFSFDTQTLAQLEHVHESISTASISTESISANQHVQPGTGQWITSLPVPAWQFLCWLADEKHLLLHGSGDPDIEEFEPRQSNDIDEFGNRKAVYAASDGIWPMFFAVTDRTRYRMTIINAAIRLEQHGVVSHPFYFFSMTDHILARQPWREGVVYLLPRNGFEAQRPYRNGSSLVHSNQWASPNPVKPLARIRVQPTDFPFLAQIRAQDDDVLAERVRRKPNGFPWLED